MPGHSEDETAPVSVLGIDGDLSESTVVFEVPLRKVSEESKKTTFTGPSRPVHRDGMGRYKVPAGGKPLTSNDIPGPGPSNYAPEFQHVTTRYPRWPFGDKDNETLLNKETPSPNKYNTGGDINWGKCRSFTMRKKIVMHDKRDDYPGPATYLVPREVSQGPKFSMRVKPKKECTPGLFSTLALKPDPKNPGPDYNTSATDWLLKPQSFGCKHKDTTEPVGPGPQKYYFPEKMSGPKWSIAGIKKVNTQENDTPGPPAYNIKSTIGNAPKFTMGYPFPVHRSRFETPGPDVYNSAGIRLDEPGFTMKYRWFESPPEKRPGPYTFSDDPVRKSCPSFSMSAKRKPTYPSSVYSNFREEGPAPNQYNIPTDSFKNGKTFSIKHRQKDCHEAPGPADYQTPEIAKINLPRAPAFTMGNKYKKKKESMPGPGSYDVKYMESKIGKSFGVRLQKKEPVQRYDALSNMPDPVKRRRRFGILPGSTLKSRHTPHKYIGLKDSSLIPIQPVNFPRPPLIG